MTDANPSADNHAESTDVNEELIAQFQQLAEIGAETGHSELESVAGTLVDLVSVGRLFSEDDATRGRGEEILAFCRHEALPLLTECDDATDFESVRQRVTSTFGDCIDALAPSERFHVRRSDSWTEDGVAQWDDSDQTDGETAGSPSFADEFESVDMGNILASLGDAADTEPNAETQPEREQTVPACGTGMPSPPRELESINDPEMLAAYADDAQLCLGEMESCLLNSEEGATTEDAQRNFCRQLHTLKGASGTVGLSLLAGYLHEVESWIEASPKDQITVDTLLECVDAVRAQLSVLGIGDSAASSVAPVAPVEVTEPAPSAAAAPAVSSPVSTPSPAVAASPSDVFVRVEASRLERLMDLLAELVMLRNRRETHVTSVRQLHDEFNLCAARTRALTTMIEIPQQNASGSNAVEDSDSSDAMQAHMAHRRFLSRSLDEIAGDTVELSRSLQEVFDPLAEDNSAVSHLIGRFRQELMELRRLPVSGLFQRLQRSIRDAAREEDKRVEIVLEGQGARAERAIQERLFEPLLHLVRNAVSHGIQTAEERVAAGKSASGTITLAAWSDASALVVEIRDDGCGLNEEALEAKGRALGLLQPGENASQAQIRQLIFHPGFSTKATVSKISGRGVGMDVVDTWVRRLRGRIDVESTPGEGTTFRLQIPLRSAVEHAMIVRAGEQLFALPMHTVSRTSDAKLSMGGAESPPHMNEAIQLSSLLNVESEETSRRLVTLRGATGPSAAPQKNPEGLTIAVDAIVGVEEVVVRSLPPLLQRNELFVGVTLSGRAETVFLLDAQRLIELSRSKDAFGTGAESVRSADGRTGLVNEGTTDSDVLRDCGDRPCILVVDDSVVVRRSLSRKLNAAGYETFDAGNGIAALKILRGNDIAAVVTDVDMPEMNGVELLQEMKRQKQFRDIPVTVLSSRDRESIPTEILDAGPNEVLAKPVTDDTISAIIETLTESSAAKS